MSSLLFVAVVGVAVIFALSAFMTSSTLPYPYDAYQAQSMPPSHLPFVPGGTHAPNTSLYDDNSNQDNAWLSRVRRLFEGQIEGVESVAVAPGGKLVLLDRYGYVHVAFPRSNDAHPAVVEYDLNPPSEFQKLYIGPGRPLGYHVLENSEEKDGDLVLLVCDSLKGLLKVNLSKRTIEILANIADDGQPINYANDLDVGPRSGQVYFTSSTSGVVGRDSVNGFYDTLRACVLNFVRGDVSGRLFVYDPQTRDTKVLLTNLFYANGVAVAHDESYVLVVETWAYRVLRLWLRDSGGGKKAGDVETFVGQLPGAPDGLSRSELDPEAFWICLVAEISPLGKLAPYPLVRHVLGSILVPLLPKLSKVLMGSTAAIKVKQQDGELIQTFLDTTSKVLKSISGIKEYGGALFFGSLNGNFVSVLQVDDKLHKP